MGMEYTDLSAPRSVADYYKLFSQACIKSVHNYYGCYGLSEINMHQGHIDIFYNEPFYIELDCSKYEEGHQWCATIHKYKNL